MELQELIKLLFAFLASQQGIDWASQGTGGSDVAAPSIIAPAVPIVSTPAVQPVVEAPSVEAPVAEAPAVELPTVEQPKVEVPVAKSPSSRRPRPSRYPASVAVPAASPVASPVASAAPVQSPTTPTGNTGYFGNSPTSGGKPMIDSLNEFRKKAGLAEFTWDAKLEANALDTGAATGGKTMRHKMNPGTYGQVLAMGINDDAVCGRQIAPYTPFELYLYAWLCERPNYPALGDICPDVLKKARIGLTPGVYGHHDLLIGKYKKIGCAFAAQPGTACKGGSGYNGIWACDLA